MLCRIQRLEFLSPKQPATKENPHANADKHVIDEYERTEGNRREPLIYCDSIDADTSHVRNLVGFAK